MESTTVFGGAMAGGHFDPMLFLQRPQVIARSLCLLFSIVVFGCITSHGWYYDQDVDKSFCHYNNDAGACNFGTGIGVIAFLASAAFLASEYLFERVSNVKTRKRYVFGDLVFSAFWAFLYFVLFCYLTNAWNKTQDPDVFVVKSDMRAVIIFSFFSIFTWAGCAYLALARLREAANGVFDLAEAGGAADPMDTNYPGAMGHSGYQESALVSDSAQQPASSGGYLPPGAY